MDIFSRKLQTFGLLLVVSESILVASVATNLSLVPFGSSTLSRKKRQTTCDNSYPSQKTDCGWPGISQSRCLEMGCCSDTTFSNYPHCFIPQGGLYTHGKMCVFHNTRERRDCGYWGINKAQCEARNCCYDSRVTGMPNCFFNTNNQDNTNNNNGGNRGITKNDIERLMRAERKSIATLHELRRKIKKAHTDYSISKTVGSGVSIGGAIATTAGIFLAPFTGGLSLGLTVGGVTAGLLGGGTTITTSIVEFVKLSEWEDELITAFGDQEEELRRIAEKIISFPEWTDTTRQVVSSTVSIGLKGASAYTMATIFRYLSIANVKYGDTMKHIEIIDDILDPSFWRSIKYMGSAQDVKEIAIPAGILWKEKGLLNKFLGKLGLPTLKIGATALKSITVGVGVVGIGFDIYTIVDTWVNDPKLVGQIDELITYLERSQRELNNFKNDLLY